jgi:DNA-binding protein HU-beta
MFLTCKNKKKTNQRRSSYMNKTELIAAIAEKTELSKKDAEKAVKAFTDVVVEELKKGEKIQLVGFGTFEVSERAARTGRNPQTGAEMNIPASKAPKFKAGKAFKDALNA